MIEVYDRLLRHDLGNDLQVITGFSNALVEAVEEGSQAAEYAEKIDRTAASAADLIGRVGDLVKTLEQEEEPEPRRLRPILVDVVESVDAKFDSLTVEFDPETVEGRVYAGDLLDSIFTNVLSNAAVHNDDPVTVAVDTEEPTPESVTVVFADDGAGVAESVREDIFEMGKKGPDSDGTGFGLGLARALTESYGGTVALSDSDAGGAEFRVTLERA
jgi:signal transduction histidine kinase